MRLMVLALSTAFAANAFAQITVRDPWVRATVVDQKATGAFMSLSAASGARLVEARSPVAGVVEIHEMTMQDNVMRMRAIDGLELPPGRSVDLKPGGYHVMLMDLRGRIQPGDRVPLTLVFEHRDKRRETVEVSATARALGAPAHKGGGHGGGGHGAH